MNQAKPGKKSNKPSYGGFEGYNLDSFLYRGIKAKGYNLPTPIQRRAIPIILQGFNVIAMARTGSGKTASFVIPIIQKLKAHSTTVGARSLILSPTRELAMQTATYFKSLAKNSDLTYVLIVGGNDMENQFERLLLNPDVIIATPGRLMHCMTQTNLQLSQVSMVVYDEADRLFEMGFAEQIKAITDRMPKSR
jgi:ATP-dependent RNA helicase DDX54/DBP10